MYFAKALAGYISSFLVSMLVIVNIDPSMSLAQLIDVAVFAAVSALLSFASVYFIPNKK